MTASFGQVQLIAFDLDGTLLNSGTFAPQAVQEAWIDLFDELGRRDEVGPAPTLDFIRSGIGKPWNQFYSDLLPPGFESHAEALRDAIFERELAIFERAGPEAGFPDYESVLETLKGRGYPLALISHASTGYFEAGRRALRLDRFLDYAECLGERVGHPKSAMLADALAATGCTVGCMIGDTVADFEAAAAHGFPSIAMTYGYGGESAWPHATIRCTALRDLLPYFPHVPGPSIKAN